MCKKTNKGFSLIELIIAVAIMAVLVGVLLPVYTKYVDRTKKTTDCTTIGAVLDACEVLSVDPDVSWGSGNNIVIVIDSNKSGSETSYTGTGPLSALEDMAPVASTSTTADWGPFTIDATRDLNGHMIFNMDDDQINELKVYSKALASRLE